MTRAIDQIILGLPLLFHCQPSCVQAHSNPHRGIMRGLNLTPSFFCCCCCCFVLFCVFFLRDNEIILKLKNYLKKGILGRTYMKFYGYYCNVKNNGHAIDIRRKWRKSYLESLIRANPLFKTLKIPHGNVASSSHLVRHRFNSQPPSPVKLSSCKLGFVFTQKAFVMIESSF